MSRRRGRRAEVMRGSLLPTLDLHGETVESARRLAVRWLEEQRAEGERVVRIVTGRGKHSLAGPVLRDEIGALLRERTGGMVIRAEEEAGGGAIRVELRAPRAIPPRAAPPLPKASPELLREAEEALAELGVAPTPELLAAEIRRIREERKRRS